MRGQGLIVSASGRFYHEKYRANVGQVNTAPDRVAHSERKERQKIEQCTIDRL
tara:strand:- start:715 stop:873 length:159 start_codon:yes stop_codon:yes gene_type:complete